jgi:DNA (cytosine-5)-methyltransferase 1
VKNTEQPVTRADRSPLRILDLFCGAGGAAMGYHRAFPDAEIVGVDINTQPRYPFEFVRADAMSFPLTVGVDFDFIHASPPCQGYSAMSACRPEIAEKYPRLIVPLRALIQWNMRCPYVIENVPGAPLIRPVELCGQMFGQELYRHRLFECRGFAVSAPPHPPHTVPASKAGHWTPGTVMSVAGHVSPIAKAREVMGIDWMNRDELCEAIPPTYTEHIGRALAAHLAAQERIAS